MIVNVDDVKNDDEQTTRILVLMLSISGDMLHKNTTQLNDDDTFFSSHSSCSLAVSVQNRQQNRVT